MKHVTLIAFNGHVMVDEDVSDKLVQTFLDTAKEWNSKVEEYPDRIVITETQA